MQMPRPCQKPLTYRIGNVDERFGLSRQEVADAVAKGASIWNKAASRDLFREESKGAIEINLVYDYRQAAADRLKALSFKIDNTKGSYEDLKLRFENLKVEYEQKKAVWTGDLSGYNARIAAFNSENESARRQGDIPDHIYKHLLSEKAELDSFREQLQARKEDLMKSAETLSSMVVVINEIAGNLNLDVVNYNDTGNALGKEFCEGQYVVTGGKQSITIYQFGNYDRLVRILIHELGHALGLVHNETPGSVMYRLTLSDSPELAPSDIAALKARCNGFK